MRWINREPFHHILQTLLVLISLVHIAFACGGGNPREDLNLDGQLNISVEEAMQAFEAISDSLLIQLINPEKVPLINKSVSELSTLRETFRESFERYHEHPALTLDDLEEHLAEAFEINGYRRDRVGVDIANIYVGDGKWIRGLAIQFNQMSDAETRVVPVSLPLSSRDTVEIDSVKLLKMSSWSIYVGLVQIGDSLASYINRDFTYVRESVHARFDSLTYSGELDEFPVTIMVDTTKRTSFSFSAGVSISEYDYMKESSWYPLSEGLPSKEVYFEGVQCYGELGLVNDGAISQIRLGMVSPDDSILYEQSDQRFVSEVEIIRVKTLPQRRSRHLSPFDWVVEVVQE